MKKLDDSYLNYSIWKDLESYFPEDYRIDNKYYPNEYFIKWKNNNIHIDHYLPKNKTKKVKLILVHGGGGNGRLLSPIGIALLKLGFECIAPDLPGFGLSKEYSPTSYSTWVELINDIVDIETEKDDCSIVLCGISLGGMLSYHVACSNDNVKAIMVSSLADTRKKEVQLQLSKNKLLGVLSLPLLNFTKIVSDSVKVPIKHTTKMWAMANNSSFVKKLKQDRIGSGSWVYLKFLRTLLQAEPSVEPENFNKCSVLFFQPENDKIIPWEISAPFYDKLNCDKKVVFLKGCGHIPMEEPGINQLKESAEFFLNQIEEKEHKKSGH